MADKEQSELIRMIRDAGQYPAPHSASVHPDEVDNYRLHGWVKDDQAIDQPSKRKTASKASK